MPAWYGSLPLLWVYLFCFFPGFPECVLAGFKKCVLAGFKKARVCVAGPDAISSKVELAKILGLERPLKKNKDKGDAALKSCLEVALLDHLSTARPTEEKQ